MYVLKHTTVLRLWFVLNVNPLKARFGLLVPGERCLTAENSPSDIVPHVFHSMESLYLSYINTADFYHHK